MVAHEDARLAAMVALERLSPDQRVAFVLHDGFAVPFADVADVLNTSEAGARQLASRARKAVAAEPPVPMSGKPDPSHDEVVGGPPAIRTARRAGQRRTGRLHGGRPRRRPALGNAAAYPRDHGVRRKGQCAMGYR